MKHLLNIDDLHFPTLPCFCVGRSVTFRGIGRSLVRGRKVYMEMHRRVLEVQGGHVNRIGTLAYAGDPGTLAVEVAHETGGKTKTNT